MEPEKLLHSGEVLHIEAPEAAAPAVPAATPPGVPSPAAQSWGVVISIIVIVLMITIGAFYAWGERIAQNRVFTAPTTAQ
ncbi:hypothetical protein KGQ72_02885 [Patescibacteria group bacterium]|nr:hypothetical protein [Patescibacteria group bacterium]